MPRKRCPKGYGKLGHEDAGSQESRIRRDKPGETGKSSRPNWPEGARTPRRTEM